MRKKIVAGNWKMNNTVSESLKLVSEILFMVQDEVNNTNLEIIIAPSFVSLYPVSQLLSKSVIKLASQNCSTEESGAYTGEVSPKMIKALSADYVIVGHSERRKYFNETNETVKKKVDILLQNSMSPIFCCGESLEERNSNVHFEIVEKQLKESLSHLSAENIGAVVIAYEPVWAIGTGLTATPAQAQEMHAFIRNYIKNTFSPEIAGNIRILYGGSCNANNAAELFSNTDVDGGLIGGASLSSRDFVNIIKSA